MLEVIALSFDYHDKPLLNKVQFSLANGKLMHLRGANGSGKTTLLKILAGLLRVEEGEVRYNGKNIYENQNHYQENLCYLGHKLGIHPWLTVQENCVFDMHWGRRAVDFETLLAGFGLQGLAAFPCHQLSAGQRRRVSLLKLAMTNARLWLLDEPLVALDKAAVRTLMLCLEHHVQTGGQVVLTSHQRLPFSQAYEEYSL